MERVREKTEADVLPWGETWTDETFEVPIGTGILRVYRRATTQSGQPVHGVALFDQNSHVIEKVEATQTSADDRNELGQLYDLVRDQAGKRDSPIDAMLRALD